MSPSRRGASAFAVAATLLVAASFGCGDDDESEPVPGRGVAEGSGSPGAAVGPEGPAGVRAKGTPRVDEALPEGRVIAERVEPTPLTVERPAEEGEGPEPPPRDLADELRDSLGDPSVCLTDQDRLIERDIAFQLRAEVQRSGAPMGVSVSSPGLSDEAIACVEAKLRQARLSPLEADQTVQTNVLLRRVDVTAAPAP